MFSSTETLRVRFHILRLYYDKLNHIQPGKRFVYPKLAATGKSPPCKELP